MSSETAGKVVPHPAAAGREDKVFNYELSFVLGKNSVQGRILTDFPQSMTEAEVAAKMDMLDRLAARQRARYDIEALEAEVEEREAQLAQWELDHREAEAAFLKQKAAIEKTIRERQAARDLEQRKLEEGRGSGMKRRAERDVKMLDHSVKQAVDEIAKAGAERDAAQANLAVNVKAAKKAIDKLKAKITAKQRVLEAPQG